MSFKDFIIESARKLNEMEERKKARLSETKPLTFAEECAMLVKQQEEVDAKKTINQRAYAIAREKLDARPRQASRIGLAFLAYERMQIDFSELLVRSRLGENVVMKYFRELV